jgi:hypothetical protein
VSSFFGFHFIFRVLNEGCFVVMLGGSTWINKHSILICIVVGIYERFSHGPRRIIKIIQI